MEPSRADVQATYDEIAEHFAATREYPWPEITDFLADVPAGELGLDVGCANGRHLAPLADRTDRVCGVDLSRPLLDLAAERTSARDDVTLVQGDATALPIADDSIDVALYIATLHHLPTVAARQASLAELARILTADGRALVSAWGVAHDRFDRETGFDTTIDWTLSDGETVARYYHIYDREEFVAAFEASPLTVLDVELSSGNYYATVEP
jgi:ubiquinone/menaquinone biosynthesis C-methylase UbiE